MTCPHCAHENTITPDTEGTHAYICDFCLRSFNYVVKEGKVLDWQPPRNVGQIYRGAGTAGGK